MTVLIKGWLLKGSWWINSRPCVETKQCEFDECSNWVHLWPKPAAIKLLSVASLSMKPLWASSAAALCSLIGHLGTCKDPEITNPRNGPQVGVGWLSKVGSIKKNNKFAHRSYTGVRLILLLLLYETKTHSGSKSQAEYHHTADWI